MFFGGFHWIVYDSMLMRDIFQCFQGKEQVHQLDPVIEDSS